MDALEFPMGSKGKTQSSILDQFVHVFQNSAICLLCTEEVEDEIHFLIKCTSKTTKRNILFTEISKTVPLFSSLDPTSKFIFLMSQEDKVINKLLIDQIYRWSTVRHRINI